MRSQVKTGAIRSALEAMDQAADAAQQVYRRVLERYPNNGKLLRCYGKFLEDVQNNPAAAGRVYMEAARNGGADGLLSLDLKIQGADKPEFLTSMDLHEDACVVINAEGKILMVNACVSTLLGYSKADLEGANVSVLMPQPFSGRHSSYLSRYVQGGQPRILDTVRDVVALHKERYVMPLRLCVTKLSGIGTDAVFLGLLRPEPLDIRNTRAWVAPNGVILCTDPQFSSLTGLINDDMVGRSFQSLVADAMEADSLLELCKEATYETLTSGTIVRHMDLLHKYLPPVPVEVRVTIGGTDMQRIFVLNAQRVHDTAEGLMVVDHRGALTFATWDLAAMLGYSLKSFLKMKLEQLLPQPFSTMHGRFLRDQPITLPPVSCRAGSVVHFVNSNGANVHVRLKITAKDDDRGGHLHHVVQVSKVDVSSHEAMYGDKRLQLFCSMDGKILLVDCPNSSIFGFLASELVGSSLADCIDVFNDWRAHAGAEQLELFLWSLLDKEEEMPGTSWQVKVLSHSHDEEGLILPNINRKAPARLSAIHSRGISACLQAELIDLSEMDSESSLLLTMGKQAGDGIDGASGATLHTSVAGGKPGLRRVSAAGVRRGSMPGATIGGSGGAGAPAAAAASSWARITLWRRSLLSGVLELDESLVIRKADVNTGLITGHPPSMLPRMPLSGLIDIPRGVSWDELMHRGRMKKSALKGGASAVVSPMRRLLGKLPDGGTIALSLQGVAGVSATGRIIATIHPDSSFPGKPGNIFRALGLEATISRRKKVAATDAGGGQRNKSNERRGREEQQQQQQEEENEEEGGNSSEDALLAEGKQSKQKGSKKKGEFVSEQAIRLRGSDGDHGDASADHEGGLPREGVGLPFGRKTRSRIPTAREGDQDSGGDAGGDGSNDGDGSSVAASFVGSAQISSGRSNDRDQDDMEEEAQEDMGKEEEEEEDEDGVGRRRRGSSSGTQKHRGHYYKGGEVDAAGMAGQPHLHRDARSHPDFIAMWARWLSRAMTAALAAQAHRLLEHKEAEEGSVGSGNGQLGDALHVVYAGPNRPASRERGAGGATLSTTAAHNNNNFCKQGNSGTAALSLPAEGPAEDPLEAYDGHLTSRHHHSRSSASTDRGAEAPSRGLQRGGPRQADSAEAAPGETQPIQRPLALPLQTEADAPSAAAAPTAAAAAAMEMHTKAGKKGKKGKGPKGTGKRKSSPRLRFKDSKDDEEDGDDGDDGGSGGGGGASQKKTGNHRRDHDNDDGGGDGGGAGGNSVEASLIGWRAVRIQAGTAHGRRRGDVEGRMLRFADAARGDSPRRREGSPPQRRSSAAVQQAAEAEAEGEGEEDDGDDDEAYQEIKRRASMVETNKMLAAAAEGFNPLKARGGGGGGDGGSNASGGGGRGGGGMSVNDAASSQADDDDTASKGPGSSAFSDSSSMADADAAAADPRRARLLKRITKLVAGPGLAEVLSRLKSRVLLLLAAMLITHITCYIILFGLIKGQFSYVRGVHQLALAADRTQVAVARSAVIEFCSRPGVAPVGVCEMPLEAVVNDVRHALDDLESYHQAIYLGTSSGHGSPIMGRELFRLWTNPVYDYRLFLDVANARWMNRTLGLFQLGNHFIAAGRELLYWAPHNKGNISHLRSFQFLQVNGPWSLFQAYTVSLDYLSEEALGHISRLQLCKRLRPLPLTPFVMQTPKYL
ncbi:hypothetical protein Vafri_5291 [Volvox africanus]|uniref:PAS domain-containing protein n=1 Tax=Volvox africanus TaxID=51714 RepID=A0A8J4AZT4_9CHLO|nr:hypothetical protein Vafri_5291 [Volvox africanus]